MTFDELLKNLNEHNLGIVLDKNDNARVVTPKIANPMIIFNLYQYEYTGSICFKSINTSLFTSDQIKSALILVDTFLSTPPKKRGFS